MIKSTRGVALLSVMFAFMIISVLIVEVTYETSIEYILASRSVQDLQARYAAKAGVELSLLRINIYKQAMAQFGDKLGTQSSLLDTIWQFPFVWPPVLPEELGRGHKENINKIIHQSFMKAKYVPTIQSEGSKIDINDLASPSEALAKATQKMILKIFENQMSSDKSWAEKHADTDYQKIINNMVDWIDEDSESQNGGSEISQYPEVRSKFIPPNQPFKTLDELHMVASMTDDLFDLISPHITVYGNKGININYAPKEIVLAVDKQFNENIVSEIIKRRSAPELGGPFKDEKDFFNFIGGLGVNESKFKENGIPLIFDTEYNFVIRSSGQFGQITREIVAIVYDFDRVKKRLSKVIGDEDKKKQDETKEEKSEEKDDKSLKDKQNDKGSSEKTNEERSTEPEGRPRIVYWYES